MSADPRTVDAVAALKNLGPDESVAHADLPYADVLATPHQHLGSFAALPASLQAFLRRFHREEEEIRTLAGGPLSAVLVRVGAVLSRALYAAERRVARIHARSGKPGGTAERLRQWLRRTARQSTHLPFMARGWLHRVKARLHCLMGGRDLGAILRAQAFDDRRLGYDYLEGLQQLPGCISVLKRQQPSVTYAQLMGLDFVQSAGLCWFLEANCNPVLMDARMALHVPGADPWVNNLLRCVLTRGYRRLIIYGYRPFRHGHGRALMEAGRRLGVDVEIFDDVFFRRHPGHDRAWLLRTGISDAFVLRVKTFDVLFDRAILSKQQTRQIVEKASVDWNAVGVGLPSLLTPGESPPQYAADSRFPNIVGKRDDLDRGMGISFYKLPRVPELAEHGVDYFEEYRVPDPCPWRIVRGQQLPSPTHGAWKIRSYALLTPEGVEYLSSIKVISGLPIPDHLPDGKVARKSIYLATINEGGVYSAVTADEDETYGRVVEATGGVLLDWLKRKYAADFGGREAR